MVDDKIKNNIYIFEKKNVGIQKFKIKYQKKYNMEKLAKKDLIQNKV